jgi:hypothetical protein
MKKGDYLIRRMITRTARNQRVQKGKKDHKTIFVSKRRGKESLPHGGEVAEGEAADHGAVVVSVFDERVDGEDGDLLVLLGVMATRRRK